MKLWNEIMEYLFMLTQKNILTLVLILTKPVGQKYSEYISLHSPLYDEYISFCFPLLVHLDIISYTTVTSLDEVALCLLPSFTISVWKELFRSWPDVKLTPQTTDCTIPVLNSTTESFIPSGYKQYHFHPFVVWTD